MIKNDTMEEVLKKIKLNPVRIIVCELKKADWIENKNGDLLVDYRYART